MRVFEVVPHVGIGPLRLGMTPAEVRHAVAGYAVEKISRGREEMIDDLGLNVDYSAGDAEVIFIQAFPVDGVRFTFAGRNVFGRPADELITEVVHLESLTAADFPPGRHEYLFPSLRLAFWRGVVAEEPGEQGWAFDSISVYVPGYYESDS